MNPAPFEATAAQLDDGVRVVAVRGELDLSTASDLEIPLEEAVASTDASVLIDLSDCEFIDSTGIALIVRAWQRLDRSADGEGSGRVVICSDNNQVRRVLEITGLELSIAIHSTRDEALAALRG
ncbi:MAG TPA: STAS domain-containing protein [Solirubrobacterales bacterium]|nr:STAS domain-containing protein [Solirubrobacterales bacterium]